MRKVWGLLVLAALAFVVIVAVSWTRHAKPGSLIGVVQFVHQPLLDETHRGLIAELNRLGLNDGIKYRVETQIAEKDVQLSSQISRQFLDRDAVLIVAIATPSAQAAAAQTKDKPIVFAAITDPVSAKLVESVEHPGHNLTGTSNRWPFERQVPLIRQLLPNAKRIGAIWNPGEANSQAAMKIIRALLEKDGFVLVEAPVATTADVSVAAKSIVDKVDAFLMIPDNTALAATDALVQAGAEGKKPLLGGDMDTVRRGGIATYGYDYFELGQVTARMVKEILIDGKHPSEMAVQYPPQSRLIINQKAATAFGLVIPDNLTSQAAEIVR